MYRRVPEVSEKGHTLKPHIPFPPRAQRKILTVLSIGTFRKHKLSRSIAKLTWCVLVFPTLRRQQIDLVDS